MKFLEMLDWEDAWQAIGILLVCAAAAVVGIFIFAPKNVDYYYMSASNSGAKALGFCVYAHWTWHTDEIAYCTDDKDRAIDFTAKANSTLIHK